MKFRINFAKLLIFILFLTKNQSQVVVQSTLFRSTSNFSSPNLTSNLNEIISPTQNYTEDLHIFAQKAKNYNIKKNDKDKSSIEGDESKNSFSQNFKENNGKIFVGAILCFLALIITLLNEFIQLRQFCMFENAYNDCQEISIEDPEKKNEGKLVLASGTIFTMDKLLDQDTGVSVENSLKLIRIVEMNQWKEVRHNGKIVYQQIWSAFKINSANFIKKNYQNPDGEKIYLDNKNFYSKESKLGAFFIHQYHIDEMKNLSGVFINASYVSSIEGNLQNILENNGLYDYGVKIKNNFIYIKKNTDNSNTDSVGDLRIRYQRIASKAFTIIAAQYENNLVPYEVSTGGAMKSFDEDNIKRMNKSTNLFWVQDEKHIKQEIFRFRDTRNFKRDWFFRILAILLCFFGIYLILFPFANSLRSYRLLSSMGKFSHLFFTLILALLSLLFLTGSFWIFRKPKEGFILILLMIPLVVLLIVIFNVNEENDKGKGGKKKLI